MAEAPFNEVDAMLDLIIGPVEGGLTEKQLEIAWEAYGEELMGWRHPDGTRPWGYWRFVLGEEMPRSRWDGESVQDKHAETIRLAELGELRDDEIAAIAEKANEARLRVGTDSERVSGGWVGTPGAVLVDREDIELYEAVTARTHKRTWA
jgi:hypothetical protein